MRRRRLNAITQSKSVATRLVNSVVATPVVTKRYFLPSSLPGCQLWLDAADNSSLVMNETNVTTWRDKSGNGYHMNTLAGSSSTYWSGSPEYPKIGTSINGLQTVNFKGQSGLKQSTTLDGVKNLFWVGRIAAPDGSGSAPNYFLLGHDVSYAWSANTYGDKFIYAPIVPAGIANASPTSLFTSDANAITNTAFQNVFLPSAPNVSLLSVAGISGNTPYQGICYDRDIHIGWCGDLAEVITFTTALTTAQRQAVEGYLAHKWGLTKYYSPTTPLSIPGCQLWLDGADPVGTGTPPANGATVSTWNDKSGNGKHSTAGGTTPTYSSVTKSIVFGGGYFTNSSLSLPLASRSVFIVCRQTSRLADFEGIMQLINPLGSDVDYASLDAIPYAGAGSNQLQTGAFTIYGNNGSYIQNYGSYTPTPLGIYVDIFGSSSGTLYVNGITNSTDVESSTLGTANGYILGARKLGSSPFGMFFNGTIYEVIVYNTVLTTSQRQTIERYLARKWGISISESFPSTHPYANYIPSPLTEFIPKSITGCGLWMDAADIGTFSFSSGSNISTWIDKSGNGRNMSVFSTSYPVLVNNAQNGNSVIAFAGVASQYLRTTSNSILINEHSRFIVYSTTAVVSGAAVLFSDDGSGGIGGFFIQGGGGGGTYQDYLGWPTDTGDQGPFQTGSTYRIGEAIITTTPNINGEVYFNGTLKTPFFNVTSSPVKQTTRILIGSRGDVGFTGRVAEFLSYDRVITTTERQQVEGYLAWKWGLNPSLPVNHPYKAFSSYSSLTNTFLPTLIPGCQIWLDGADPGGGGIQPANGSVLSSWNDKSGFGRHATTAGSAPTYTTNSFNNRQAITLNGSSSLGGNLTGSGTTLTVCIVATQASGCVSDGGLVCFGRTGFSDWNDVGSLAITKWASNSGQMVCTRVTNSQTVNTGLSTPFIYILVFDGTFVNSYLNGTIQTPTSISNTGTFAYTKYTIGTRASPGNALWTGLIGEVIIYHSALTTTERQQVESYLAWKWGLQGSLPSDHTYKFAPPSV